MQLHSFNLHGLSCYYNVGEVVKKNVNLWRWKSINSFDDSIRNTYDEEKKSGGADAPPEEIHDLKGETRSHLVSFLLYWTTPPMTAGAAVTTGSVPIAGSVHSVARSGSG